MSAVLFKVILLPSMTIPVACRVPILTISFVNLLLSVKVINGLLPPANAAVPTWSRGLVEATKLPLLIVTLASLPKMIPLGLTRYTLPPAPVIVPKICEALLS